MEWEDPGRWDDTDPSTLLHLLIPRKAACKEVRDKKYNTEYNTIIGLTVRWSYKKFKYFLQHYGLLL